MIAGSRATEACEPRQVRKEAAAAMSVFFTPALPGRRFESRLKPSTHDIVPCIKFGTDFGFIRQIAQKRLSLLRKQESILILILDPRFCGDDLEGVTVSQEPFSLEPFIRW
jgi:hypothetical protein